MQVTLVIVLCCVLGVDISIGQITPLYVHAVFGELPEKYYPLTKVDKAASTLVLALFPTLVVPLLPASEKVNHIGPLDIHVPELLLKAKLNLYNVEVHGINQISLRKVEMRLRNNRIDFVAKASGISGNADFQIRGTLGVIPVVLSGIARLNTQDLHPAGAVAFKKSFNTPVGPVYQVVAGDVTLDIQNIEVIIKHGNTSAINAIKNKVIEKIKDDVSSLIMATVFSKVNLELEKVPANVIDSIILKKS